MANPAGFGRRGFLSLLAAAVLDPERLLWIPGRKLISIPAISVPPFLAVGDVVMFGDWPERYAVTEAAQSAERIGDARFVPLAAFAGMYRAGTLRIGDTLWNQRMNLAAETMTLVPGGYLQTPTRL